MPAEKNKQETVRGRFLLRLTVQVFGDQPQIRGEELYPRLFERVSQIGHIHRNRQGIAVLRLSYHTGGGR